MNTIYGLSKPRKYLAVCRKHAASCSLVGCGNDNAPANIGVTTRPKPQEH
jgi:hypothetical protein